MLANILVVTDPASASAQPDDLDLLNFLTSGGHTIDADSGAFLTAPPTPAQLADVDLIIVSRTTNSGNYDDGSEPVDWNALNKPLLLMAPHLARSSHWGWINSTTLPADATAPANYDAFPNAAHPFVNGLTTAFAALGPGIQIDSLNSTAVPVGATTVATITTSASAAAIVDIPAGATAFNSRGTFGERRVYFTIPDYPDKPNQDFDDVLSQNAKNILLQIIDEVAGPTVLEAEDATLVGPTIETLNPGFTGTGYADYGNTPGQYIEWTVNVGLTGLYDLDFRYANGSVANRPLELRINGNLVQAAQAFNPTGAWTNWQLSSAQGVLNSGNNLVRLTMTGTEGPNIDSLDFSFDSIVVTPPSAPTSLITNVISSSQINLFWTDNADNETEYQVERKLASGGSFELIATLGANTTNFSSTGLAANTQYVYRVRAANGAGPSAYSNEANGTTLQPNSSLPSVTATNPAQGATGVLLNQDIVAEVHVPNGGINAATLTASTVKLYPTGNPGAPVNAVLNTSGGGDIIVLRPVNPLAANTSYTFEVTSGLKDFIGEGFVPFQMSFTTGTMSGSTDNSIQFQKVQLSAPTENYTSVTIGPDGKLYAASLDGDIYRWIINADGTLGTMEHITSLKTAEGGNRALIGFVFDPSSTAGDLKVWVTHTQFGFSGMPDFVSKLTRLSGPNLETVQDFIIHLPRSARDHLTNQVVFGPDGAMYFLQGSNSAMGDPDPAWSNRPERLLSAAVLRFDPALWDATVNGPLDVHTEDADPYDPFAANAPLTIYASGIRNAYDLLWHSNGFLYVPTNGSAAGGHTPATPAIPPEGLLPRIDSAVNGPYMGPVVPGLETVSTQRDYLFRVVQGGYYGHPNPSRNEYVLNGGNPTSGADPSQVQEYPVGTLPDRNWRGAAFDFGTNRSPNGVIEYRSSAFGGALLGKILVVRYSSGDDIMVLTPGASGDIVTSNDAIASFDGFIGPLDLVEDTRNGNLYVVEQDGNRIFLLRPQEPNLIVNKNQLIFDEVRGGAASAAKTITVTNSGTGTLTLSSISITGTDAALFSLSPSISTPVNIAPGNSLNINVVFNPPGANPLGPKMANLRLLTNDPLKPTVDFYLGGLTTPGEEGNNEPSLQWILDTFRIPIDVGDPNDATAPIEGIVLPNANNIPRFVKAGAGAVTIESLAVFSGDTFAEPAAIVGWYTSPAGLTELFRHGSGDSGQHQEMNPTLMSGVTAFDPGLGNFGMYSQWPTFPGRTVYSENHLNTFDSTTQKHIVFPLLDQQGQVVPNTYVVGIEEAANNDFQDLVYIIRNVVPYVPALPGDFNANGEVDAADYVVWRNSLGQAISLPNEAATFGTVTQDDLLTWRANFGRTLGSGGSGVAEMLPYAVRQPVGTATAEAFASLDDEVEQLPPLFSTVSQPANSRSTFRPAAAVPTTVSDDAALLALDQFLDQLNRRTAGAAADSSVAAHDDAYDTAATGDESLAEDWQQF